MSDLYVSEVGFEKPSLTLQIAKTLQGATKIRHYIGEVGLRDCKEISYMIRVSETIGMLTIVTILIAWLWVRNERQQTNWSQPAESYSLFLYSP